MQRPSLDAVRGFDRAVYVVAFGQLVNVFGSGLVYPFATVHFHFRVGIALAVVGLGLGARSVTTAAGTVVVGYLADAVGRKPVMVASMALSAVALAGEVGGAGATPPAVLLGVGLVGGHLVVRTLGEILHAPLASALMSDLGVAAARGTQLSVLETAKRLGIGLGSFAGGLFFDYGLSGLLWPTLVGVCALVAVGLGALERSVTSRENGAGGDATGAEAAD